MYSKHNISTEYECIAKSMVTRLKISLTYCMKFVKLYSGINTHGPGLSYFLRINKPQLLCENVFVKCKILPIFEKKFI
jgi:hypothetical protein